MSGRRKKRYADAWEGYTRAIADSDAAQSELIKWAAKLGDARSRVDHYRKRLSSAMPRPTETKVIVSKAAAECVERMKRGARDLAEQSGIDIPSEGAPRERGGP